MTPTRDNDWPGVWLAVTAGVVAAIHFGKVAPALPELLSAMPIGLVLGGWIVSIVSLTGALVGIAMGAVADALGARRTVLTGLSAIGAGSLLGALSGDAATLLLSRSIEGLGFIAVAVGAPVLVVRSVDADNRQLALGLWITYLPAGMALAMLVVPELLRWIDWRQLWAAAAALALLSAGSVWYRFAAEAPPRHGRLVAGVVQMARPVLRSRGSWLLSIAFLFYTLQWISLMAWLPTFLVQEKAMGPAAVGGLTALVVICNVPGNLTVSWLLVRGGQRWLLLVTGALGMAVGGWVALTPGFSDPLRLAATLAFSYFGGFVPAAVLSGAPLVAPEPSQIGGVNGMMVQGAQLGQVLGPPSLAAIMAIRGEWADSRWLLLAAAGLLCLVALAYRVDAEAERPPPDVARNAG